MAKPTTNPRSMEGTTDETKSKYDEMVEAAANSDEFPCAVCDKPIVRGEEHVVWLGFSMKPNEHFHKRCFDGSGASEAKDTDEVQDFAGIIGSGVSLCMRERAAHQQVEQRITEWFSRLPANKDERLKMISASRAQMETARLAIEAFYLRFRGLASTAKN